MIGVAALQLGSLVRQTTFSVSVQRTGRSLAVVVLPFRSGPRHCGQLSSACATNATITINKEAGWRNILTSGGVYQFHAKWRKAAHGISAGLRPVRRAVCERWRSTFSVGGTLYTPSERYVLPGISRQMTLDLARKLAIPVIEGDIDLFDAANAEEMFLTSTSLCIAGVRSFNGARIGDGRAPGPITKRLTDAYIAEVGCDFVKQYLDRLS